MEFQELIAPYRLELMETLDKTAVLYIIHAAFLGNK